MVSSSSATEQLLSISRDGLREKKKNFIKYLGGISWQSRLNLLHLLVLIPHLPLFF